MFNSNNEYMQDFYFYNQVPNSTYMNNPMMMPNTMGNPYGMVPNFNTLYPSIYKIIAPVISNVIANSNYQYLNQESLNNMTDTVYNIVESQIEYDIQDTSTTSNTQSQSRTQENTRQTNTKQDYMLKDIIKILILKEISVKIQSSRMHGFYMNQFM